MSALVPMDYYGPRNEYEWDNLYDFDDIIGSATSSSSDSGSGSDDGKFGIMYRSEVGRSRLGQHFYHLLEYTPTTDAVRQDYLSKEFLFDKKLSVHTYLLGGCHHRDAAEWQKGMCEAYANPLLQSSNQCPPAAVEPIFTPSVRKRPPLTEEQLAKLRRPLRMKRVKEGKRAYSTHTLPQFKEKCVKYQRFIQCDAHKSDYWTVVWKTLGASTISTLYNIPLEYFSRSVDDEEKRLSEYKTARRKKNRDQYERWNKYMKNGTSELLGGPDDPSATNLEGTGEGGKSILGKIFESVTTTLVGGGSSTVPSSDSSETDSVELKAEIVSSDSDAGPESSVGMSNHGDSSFNPEIVSEADGLNNQTNTTGSTLTIERPQIQMVWYIS